MGRLVRIGVAFVIGIAAFSSRHSEAREVIAHEILANFSESGIGAISFGSGGLGLALGAGYNYRLISFLQLGARVGVVHRSNSGVSSTSFGFLAGPAFNFPLSWKFQNQFYGSVLFGIAHAAAPTGTQTPFVFNFEVGKRFELFPNVSYRPAIGFTVGTNGEVLGNARLLALSLLF